MKKDNRLKEFLRLMLVMASFTVVYWPFIVYWEYGFDWSQITVEGLSYMLMVWVVSLFVIAVLEAIIALYKDIFKPF